MVRLTLKKIPEICGQVASRKTLSSPPPQAHQNYDYLQSSYLRVQPEDQQKRFSETKDTRRSNDMGARGRDEYSQDPHLWIGDPQMEG